MDNPESYRTKAARCRAMAAETRDRELAAALIKFARQLDARATAAEVEKTALSLATLPAHEDGAARLG